MVRPSTHAFPAMSACIRVSAYMGAMRCVTDLARCENFSVFGPSSILQVAKLSGYICDRLAVPIPALGEAADGILFP